MIIHALRPHSLILEMDHQQALIISEAVNMIANDPGALNELEYRLMQLGQTTLRSMGILGSALQGVDTLSKALGVGPYCECHYGEEKPENEEGTTYTEETNTVKPN